MAWKWFVQKNDAVEGPLQTEQVQAGLASGQFKTRDLIWGRGLEWQTLQNWQITLPSLNNPKAPGEVSLKIWHYASGGGSHGPMTRESLVNELKVLSDLGQVMLWTKGMPEWAPVFDFHEILNAVGANKRQFPRVELMGKAVLKFDGGEDMIAPMISLSESGFGIKVENGLSIGQVVLAELQSKSFREKLIVKAEVRFVSEGLAGFKFTQISSENKGTIIQLIKMNQSQVLPKAA